MGSRDFFFPLSFKNIFSSFFLTGDRTACFNAAGNDPVAVTKVMMSQKTEGLLLKWGPWLVGEMVWCPEEDLAQRPRWSTRGKGRVYGSSLSGKKEDCVACPAHPSVISAFHCLCGFLQLVSCRTLIMMQMIPVHRNANEVRLLESNLLPPCGQTGFASICKFISESFIVILSILL